MTRRYRYVAGLDLSLTSTGLAVVNLDTMQTAVTTITSTGSKSDTWADRHRRLATLTGDISNLIPADALTVIEAPSYGSKGGSQFDRAALWWRVYDDLVAPWSMVLPVEPTVRMKYATGKGNSGKDAVLAAAVRRYPNVDINGNDIADAVCLMAIGCRLLGEPIDDPMPVLNLSALTKLSLPEEA